MPHEIHGHLRVAGERFALVVSRFHEFITSKLRDGALDALQRHGCAEDHVTCVHVPGALEIPLVAKRLAESGAYDAVICLGCVIRGQTSHFEYVAGECARGVAQAAFAAGVPVVFGVITADTLEQAIDRAGGKLGNKGFDAALTAIEQVHVLAQLPPPRG
jgi:6,7-dimethyl-8-ribityllumazine synthase